MSAFKREPLLVLCLLLVGLGVRVSGGRDWVFAGSDSFAYLRLASELHDHSRFALDPPPAPLYWGRLPGYPLLIAPVLASHPDRPVDWARLDGHDSQWRRIQALQIALDLLGVGLFAWAIARRLGGWPAGLGALAAVMVVPINAVFSLAVMTETAATALTLAVVWLALCFEYPVKRWFVIGLLFGAGFLVRFDFILLAPALGVAWWLSRSRLLSFLVAVAGFGLIVSPWVLRNQAQFGAPHVFVEHVDRYSHPYPEAAGFRDWVSAWARDDQPLRSLVYCSLHRSCVPSLDAMPAEAFDGPSEKAAVASLLAQRRQDGWTADLSAQFSLLARARRLRHPFQTWVALPIERSIRLWWNPHDDLIHGAVFVPWRNLMKFIRPFMWAAGIALTLGIPLACFALWSQRRQIVLILAVAIVARTVVLAFMWYPEPRYIVEVIPLGYALIAAALLRRRELE